MYKLKKSLKIIIISQLLLLQICHCWVQIEPHVVKGRATSIQNARHLVQLFVDKEFWCGGSLTATRFVVTAAHCVNSISSSRIWVKAGASLLSEVGVQARVNSVMVPRSYNPTTNHMDVAVLKLDRHLQGPLIRPVALCTQGWRHNDPVQLFGWGTRGERSKLNPNQVESVNLRVVGRWRCRASYGFLTTSMFCAALPGRSSCYGDSGGPVMVKGQFCGIVSFAKGCARPGFPDVYTNVLFANVNNFIRNCMRM